MEFAQTIAEGENIWTAASDGDIPRVQILLASGISVNAQDENGYSPLHAAVSYGHQELISLLVSAGGDINIRDADGDQPIHYVEEPEIYELLIRFGADPSSVNSNGEGLMDKIVEDENESMMNYLVAQGVSLPAGSLPTFSFGATEMEGEEEHEETEEPEA